MTNKELQQVYYLRKEIKMWKNKLKELSDLKSVNYNSSGHSNGISSPVQELAERREKIRQIITGKENEIILQEQVITEYIMTIDISLIRQIMYKRHIELKSWSIIAAEVGGKNTAESVRKMHERFLLRS